MENRSVYEIVSGMSGEGYCSVVRTASGLSRWFGVIERSNPDHYLPVIQRLLNDLVPYLSDIEQVQSWPGTQVVGSRTETRLLFDVTPESVEMVLRSSSCFWDWANTDYPDDYIFCARISRRYWGRRGVRSLRGWSLIQRSCD